MAVGTVSGVSPEDTWQLVATATPTSGTSFTLATGLAGIYKELIIVYRNLTFASASGLHATFNADTTVGNYGFTNQWQGYIEVGDSVLPLMGYTGYSTSRTGFAKIKNANQAIPHTAEGGGYASGYISGAYAPATPAVINSVEIKTQAAVAFTGGTCLLYGIPA
jgi:hypothetical protein